MKLCIPTPRNLCMRFEEQHGAHISLLESESHSSVYRYLVSERTSDFSEIKIWPMKKRHCCERRGRHTSLLKTGSGVPKVAEGG
jgi:hypothetical protein